MSNEELNLPSWKTVHSVLGVTVLAIGPDIPKEDDGIGDLPARMDPQAVLDA